MDDAMRKNSKRRSQVWQHFQILNMEKARCNCCGVQLHFRGSTFNLKRHLANKHKEIDVSQLLKAKNSKLKSTSKLKSNLHHFNGADSEDSIYWVEDEPRLKNEENDETQDIVIDTSDQSMYKSDEILDSKEEMRVVSFDFEDYKHKTENLDDNDKDQPIHDYNVEISRLVSPRKKRKERLLRENNEDLDFRETQIFGDFVASQLRILDKKKREKLQILIQRAILDVVCEDPNLENT